MLSPAPEQIWLLVWWPNCLRYFSLLKSCLRGWQGNPYPWGSERCCVQSTAELGGVRWDRSCQLQPLGEILRLWKALSSSQCCRRAVSQTLPFSQDLGGDMKAAHNQIQHSTCPGFPCCAWANEIWIAVSGLIMSPLRQHPLILPPVSLFGTHQAR